VSQSATSYLLLSFSNAVITQSFDDVCFYCGDIKTTINEDIQKLNETHGIVRPICKNCLVLGLVPATRNAVKVGKKQKKH
jgi:hypothetical protein